MHQEGKLEKNSIMPSVSNNYSVHMPNMFFENHKYTLSEYIAIKLIKLNSKKILNRFVKKDKKDRRSSKISKAAK